MERTCGEHAARCPPHVLRDKHARARSDALQAAARVAASGQRRREWRQRLEQELDAPLNHYLLLNERKIETAVATAKNLYQSAMLGEVEERNICKYPDELAAALERGEAAALQEFDRNRERPAGVDAWITRRHNDLETKNEVNNEAAVSSCHEYFLGVMPGPTENQILNAFNSVFKVVTQPFTVVYELGKEIMSSEDLFRLCRERKAEALARFDVKRNPGGASYDVDPYKDNLKALMDEYEYPCSKYEVFNGVDSGEHIS